MSQFIEINGVRIGAANPVYVIAELSANHNGKLSKALATMARTCTSPSFSLTSEN